MNPQQHIRILYVLVALLLLGLVYVVPTSNSMMGRVSMMTTRMDDMGLLVSDEDMDEMMENMMGTNDTRQMKIVKPSDRVERLQPTIAADGAKEFSLNAEPILWEYAVGKTISAWGYNGQIPGPEIRVTEGDRVRVKFTNNLPKATTIHWHGIHVPYTMDGVPGVSQDAIEPGETFTYEFAATPAGTRFYHTHGSSHTDEAQQMDMGLSGAFIIEAKDAVKPDQDVTLVLDEWQTGSPDGSTHNMAMMDMGHEGGHMMNYNIFTINGRAFPDTTPVDVKEGERVRIRLINAGSSTTHPIHLHGHSFRVVAVDGNEVPEVAQFTRDTITLAPGERYDIEVVANNPGVWLIHCHELHHADGGMIMPLLYEGFVLPEISDEVERDTDTNMMNSGTNGMHNMHGL